MNKKLILQIAVVALVLIFLLEPLGFINNNRNFVPPAQDPGNIEKTFAGTTEVDGTVVSYKSYLTLSTRNISLVEDLKTNPAVDDIQNSPNGVIILLKEGENMSNFYKNIQERNLTGNVRAEIRLPSRANVSIENSTKEAQFKVSIPPRDIEPVYDLGGKIRLRMSVVLSGETIVNIGTVDIVDDNHQIVGSTNEGNKTQKTVNVSILE